MRENPIKLRYWFLFLCITSIVFVMRDYIYSINNQRTLDWAENIASNGSDMLFWFPFIPLIYLLKTKFDLRRIKVVPLVVLFTICIALLHRLLAVYLGKYLELTLNIIQPDYYERVKAYYFAIIAGGTINDLIFVWICIGLYVTVDYIKKYRTEQQQNLQISKELTDSKLQTLQGQLQPHFLFNTLHTVSSLMDENVEKAQSIMSRLANFLRYSLDYQDRKFASLADEIEFIRNYLDIESERFRDRLSISYSIDPETNRAKIPAFILQPLIENAIRHGVSLYSSVNKLKLKTQIDENRLIIEISQNGESIDIEKLKSSDGIGINNTISRLNTIYQSDYMLNFENKDGLTIELNLPLRDFK